MRPLKKANVGTLAADNTSQVLVAANAGRKWMEIYNGSDVAIWLGFGAAAVVGTGTHIAIGDSFVIDELNLWQGEIRAIAASGSGKTVSFTEFS